MGKELLEKIEEAVIPHLYGVLLWATTAAGFTLLTKDLWTGMGVAGAYSLYNIFTNMYMVDMQELAIKKMVKDNDKSSEA